MFNEILLLVIGILMLHSLLYRTAESIVFIGYSILATLTVLIAANTIVIVVTLLEQRRERKLK